MFVLLDGLWRLCSLYCAVELRRVLILWFGICLLHFFPEVFVRSHFFFLRYWLGGVGCGNKRVLPACIGFILLTGT